MSIATRIRSRLTSISAVCALAVGGILVGASPAAADISPIANRAPEMVTADVLPTVQINGVVWSQEILGNRVFAGGSFTNARPAGSAPNQNTTARGNLLAYNLTTGALDTSFAPTLNGQVRVVELSPNGSRLYVGGDFTTANGTTHRRLVAYDTATGQVIQSFNPNLDASVRTIVATDTTVYAGGSFSTANGVARSRLAAFSASTGALTSWAPTANRVVSAMVMAPGGTKIIAGGQFETINGVSAYGMGAIDAFNGAILPWPANLEARAGGPDGSITSLRTDGNAIYGTAYIFGGFHEFEGTFSADPATGELNWVQDCHGDTYDSWSNGTQVYTVSHAHYCSTVGAFPQSDPWSVNMRRAIAFTAEATGTLGHNIYGGYKDWFGTPSPSMINWFPDLAAGTFTGQSQAAWTITGNSQYVVLGGEFPSVNGTAQQGLVRFAIPSIAPKKQGPRVTWSNFQPTLMSLGSNAVRVGWQSNWDRDDLNLTYQVLRNNQLIRTVTADATFWNRPNQSFIDSAVTPGATYTYRIRALDPDGNVAEGQGVAITVPTSGTFSDYGMQVLADQASLYWRLSEPSGSTVTDFAGSNTGTAAAGVGRGAAGAIAGDADAASTFSGGDGTSVVGQQQLPGPNVFSAEAWFNTSSTTGGKIFGFGGAASGTSSNYDRHVYLDNQGRVWFGVYPGGVQTVNSAASFNDGEWHHVVASLGSNGMSLFVDGQNVGQRADVTSAEGYNGYWRVGGDNINGWPGQPATSYLNGTIDEFAVYPTVLDPATVAAHYDLATGVVPNVAPVASFDSEVADLTVDVTSTSTDSDGIIASYLWDFGDDVTATTASASHSYATSGTYTVSLTVTDDRGGSHTVTEEVQVLGPNVPPISAFDAAVTDLSVAVTSTSTDPDGSIEGYLWDFGDGATASTPNASHAYAAAGIYSVGLTVTDNRGGTNTSSQNVTVTAPPNQAPVASFTYTVSGLGLNVVSTSTDPDGTIAGYSWDFGDTGTATGATAGRTYAAAGTYPVTLTVVDNLGATSQISQNVTVTSAPAALITDTFSRTTTNGWGAAEVGGAWTVVGPTRFSTISTGRITIPAAGVGPTANLNSVSAQDLEGTVDIALEQVPTGGGAYASVATRKVGNSDYRFGVRFLVGGSVQLSVSQVVSGVETKLGTTIVLPNVNYAVGDVLRLKFRVQGSGTTTLSAKAWETTAAEPADYQSVRTSTQAGLQGPGAFGVQGYLSGSTTGVPLTVSFDNLSVTGIQ